MKLLKTCAGTLLASALLAGCGGAADDAATPEAGAETSASGDGSTTTFNNGEDQITLTTDQTSANVPLGFEQPPGSEVAYEMNRGEGDAIDYSGSFTTQMDQNDAIAFYADKITAEGGTITRDTRDRGHSFSELQGTLASGHTFFVQATDLREKRGYVQVDLKLEDAE